MSNDTPGSGLERLAVLQRKLQQVTDAVAVIGEGSDGWARVGQIDAAGLGLTPSELQGAVGLLLGSHVLEASTAGWVRLRR